jgi:prepilin-type N-terminal cleavage/methylation domain-containing protein
MRRTLICRGFTMVEMIIVVAVIAVLIGVLLPALSGVQKRSRKMVEFNNLRQVNVAWMMYATANKDAALPGWLQGHSMSGGPGMIATTVQDAWRVRYEFHLPMDPLSASDRVIPQEIAAPWTWRLMQYMDNNPEVVWAYRGEPLRDAFSNRAAENLGIARRIAYEPAFGYNGYYIGGWWEMVTYGGDATQQHTRALPRFHNATVDGAPASLVVRSVPQITRTDEVVIFCGAATVNPGAYSRIDDMQAGAHIVTPPMLGETPHWRLGWNRGPGSGETGPGGDPTGPNPGGGSSGPIVRQDDPNAIVALRSPGTAVPAPRYNRQVAVTYADGSVKGVAIPVLATPRSWINAATTRTFSHN